jgi:histidinol-phosphatase (PHP family)
MVDLHVHCDYSIDAEGSVDEYARAALGSGLSHICFTTHCDLDPDRRHHDGRVKLNGEIVDVTSDWLQSYVDEVTAAQRAYAGDGLTILCGLEIGYVPGIERMIEDVIASQVFDFVLGGIHTLSGIDIVSPREAGEYFKSRTPRQVCEEYFDYVEQAIASGLFDCIAHIDIYKRCGLDFYGDSLNVAHRGLIEKSLSGIGQNGMSLEINSGGLRKGLVWPYPSPDILKAAKDAGVTHLTVGSDCHRPEDIGSGLDRCLELGAGAGLGDMVVYESRRRLSIRSEETDA